jgi:seryl-tRNA synthetase
MKIHSRDEEHDASRRTPSTIAKDATQAEQEMNRCSQEVKRVLVKLEKAERPLNETDTDEEPVMPFAPNFGTTDVPMNDHFVKELLTGEGIK